MSNKSMGIKFEHEFAQLLADSGFWAHCMKDNANGQPFDVIAAQNGMTYVFDCKDCQSGVFRLSRVEENQHNAMELWESTGNYPGMFVLRFDDCICVISHDMLMNFRENDVSGIGKEAALLHGESFEQWLRNRNLRNKQVKQCR